MNVTIMLARVTYWKVIALLSGVSIHGKHILLSYCAIKLLFCLQLNITPFGINNLCLNALLLQGYECTCILTTKRSSQNMIGKY